jgi:predicted nucleic acid-binding protein
MVPACFNNPLKRYAVDFLTKVLAQKRREVIPVTAVIGAYHIATRYLKAPRLLVKKVLEGMLRTKSPALYPHVSPELAIDSLDYATVYNIESWDGYLIALARSLGTKMIYSMDEELTKVKEIVVVNPFPEDKLREYHEWIKAKKP